MCFFSFLLSALTFWPLQFHYELRLSPCFVGQMENFALFPLPTPTVAFKSNNHNVVEVHLQRHCEFYKILHSLLRNYSHFCAQCPFFGESELITQVTDKQYPRTGEVRSQGDVNASGEDVIRLKLIILLIIKNKCTDQLTNIKRPER